MSGGYVKEQSPGDHQVVIFTFIGKMTKEDIAQWNQAVLDLKKRFGPNLVGVTIGGDPTPKNLTAATRSRKK
jgi:hypothetical protein